MREPAEKWYTLTTHRLHSPQLIEKFLHSDVYGFDFNPCALVRKMDVVHYLCDDAPELLEQICLGLAPLANLDPGANVQITLRVPNYPYALEVDEFRFIRAENLVVLFPRIKQLVEGGLQVTMQIGTSLNLKFSWRS